MNIQSIEYTQETLAQAWLDAKAREAEAARERIEIEKQLIEVLGERDEGSKTHTLENGAKVTITSRLSYKVPDLDALLEVVKKLPAKLRPIKTVLDETGVKYLRDQEPELYAVVATAIEVSKAKTGVTVKAV
jgi:hypothetical protein